MQHLSRQRSMHSRYAVVSWACPVLFHHMRDVAGVLERCFIGEDCWQAKLLPRQ